MAYKSVKQTGRLRIPEVDMLTSDEKDELWNNMLQAQIRSLYFAELSSNYRRRQKFLTVASLVMSSGAFAALVASLAGWVPKVCAAAAALLGFINLVSKHEATAILCSDLHRRWNSLALDYKHLFTAASSKHLGIDQQNKLYELEQRETELSEASVPQHLVKGAMKRAEDVILAEHRSEAA